MSHASEDDLLEMALRAAEPDAVENAHLAACADCAARYRAVLAEQSLLRRAFAGPAEVPARLERSVAAPRRRLLPAVAAALLAGAALGALLVSAGSPRGPADALSLRKVEEELRRIPAEVESLRDAEPARLEAEAPRVLSRAEALYAERLERLLETASPLSEAQRVELRAAVVEVFERVWTEGDVEKLARGFRESLHAALNEAQYRALEERLALDREADWEQELEIVIDELSEALNLRFSEAEEVRRTLREHFPKTDLPLLSMAQWPPDRLAGDRKLSGAVRTVLPSGYHAAFGRYVDSLSSGRRRFEQAARRKPR